MIIIKMGIACDVRIKNYKQMKMDLVRYSPNFCVLKVYYHKNVIES